MSRSAYSLLNLSGRNVEVKLTSGTVITGTFAAQGNETEKPNHFRMLYPLVTKVGSDSLVIPDTVNHFQVEWSAVESLFCKNGALDASKRGFRTDTAISGRGTRKGPRRLENVSSAWLEPVGPGDNGTLKDDSGDKAWDQFQVNAEKFGVKNTYDETLYTMKLEKESLTAEQLRKAEQIAREIEGKVSSNPHLMEERGHEVEGWDEEARYGAVVGSGAYNSKGTTDGPTAPAWGDKKKAWRTDQQSAPGSSQPPAPPSGAQKGTPPGSWGKRSSGEANRSFASVLRGTELAAGADKNEASALQAEKAEDAPKPAPLEERKKLTEVFRNFSKDISESMKSKEASAAAKEKNAENSTAQTRTTSKLNPAAKPFTLKASAKPFVPGGSGNPSPHQQPASSPMTAHPMHMHGMVAGYPPTGHFPPHVMVPGTPMYPGMPGAPMGMAMPMPMMRPVMPPQGQHPVNMQGQFPPQQLQMHQQHPSQQDQQQ